MNNAHVSPMIRMALASLAALLFLSACGNVYRADIQGQVEDLDNETGINLATVRIYEQEPDAADAAGFIVRTQTATTGGTAGVFQTTVVWQSLFGSFGDQADTTSLWLGVTAEDYDDLVVEVPGVLSDASNTVGTFRLLDATRNEESRSAVIQGRVFRENAANEDVAVAGYFVAVGVRNAADDAWLDPDNAPDDFDFPATVTTGAGGTFAFVVEWPGEEQEPNLNDVRMGLFYWDEDPGDGNRLVATAAAFRSITVEDGDNEFVRDVVRTGL